MLFDIPPIERKDDNPNKDKKCRQCKHIKNLNPYSDRYWYCMINECSRTTYGYKAVKRMSIACKQFESK